MTVKTRNCFSSEAIAPGPSDLARVLGVIAAEQSRYYALNVAESTHSWVNSTIAQRFFDAQ